MFSFSPQGADNMTFTGWCTLEMELDSRNSNSFHGNCILVCLALEACVCPPVSVAPKFRRLVRTFQLTPRDAVQP